MFLDLEQAMAYGVYAQFKAQAAVFNYSKKRGLLRGDGTCFATWVYSIHWLI